MQIDIHTNHHVDISKLNPGDTFIYNTEVFLKLDSPTVMVKDHLSGYCFSVNLSRNSLTYFAASDTKVLLVKTKVVVT